MFCPHPTHTHPHTSTHRQTVPQCSSTATGCFPGRDSGQFNYTVISCCGNTLLREIRSCCIAINAQRTAICKHTNTEVGQGEWDTLLQEILCVTKRVDWETVATVYTFLWVCFCQCILASGGFKHIHVYSQRKHSQWQAFKTPKNNWLAKQQKKTTYYYYWYWQLW